MSAPEWLLGQLAVMSGRRVGENVKGIKKAATDRISISNTAAQHVAFHLAQYGHNIGIRVEGKDIERFRMVYVSELVDKIELGD